MDGHSQSTLKCFQITVKNNLEVYSKTYLPLSQLVRLTTMLKNIFEVENLENDSFFFFFTFKVSLYTL